MLRGTRGLPLPLSALVDGGTRLSKWRFDDWGYLMQWPAGSDDVLSRVTVVVEDIKFAFNAWLLLRHTCFFGTRQPLVVSTLRGTVPTMDIAVGGNRIFHQHVSSGAGQAALTRDAYKVALTPSHPKAIPLADMDWDRDSNGSPIELVLGHENGLSNDMVARCDAAVTIPQYGSVGSMSMNTALSVSLSRISASLLRDDCDARHDRRRRAPWGVETRLSSDPYAAPAQHAERPHADEFLALDGDESVRCELSRRRTWFDVRVVVVWENESCDRNIGASFRSLNVHNADGMVLLGRRAFNKRGTLGTHHYTPWRSAPSWDSLAECLISDSGGERVSLRHVEVWGLWCDYPYRSDYLGTGGALPPSVASQVLSCDDSQGILQALRAIRGAGKKGIVLAVSEDGASLSRDAWSRCDRLLRICSTPGKHQVGIGPASAIAIALERIRHCTIQLQIPTAVHR